MVWISSPTLRTGLYGCSQQWRHVTSPLLRRLYSAETSSGRPIALNIVDPWLPPPFPSSSLSTEWERLKKRLVRTYVFFKLSRELPGWKKPAFTALIQDKYVGMNEAFAAKDKSKLSRIVSDSLLAELNPKLKKSSAQGRLVWKFLGANEKPKVVNAVIAKVMMENNKTDLVAQLTVKISCKQAAGVYSGGELIAGDITKPQNVTEFIVAERCITNPYSEWKIAGKVVPKAVTTV